MGLFKIDKVTPVKIENSMNLTDGTFDSNSIYLVDGTSENIIVISRDLKNYSSIRTNKVFNNITYDNKEHCFWAYSKFINDVFFKFDEHMNEVGNINIPNYNLKKINSLNYNSYYNCLTITSCGTPMDINKNSILINNIVIPHFLFSTCTYCFDNLSLSLCKMDSSDILSLCDRIKRIALFKLPENIKYQSILYAIKKYNIIKLKLLILDKSGYSYIAHCSININDYIEEPLHYDLENFTYACTDLEKVQ